jgi:hypothetical protein
MKTRNGFVSNSSSSSFVCSVCGGVEEDYEGPSAYCDKCGAQLCCDCAADVGDEENPDITDNCPSCKLEVIDSEVMLKYLLKVSGRKWQEVADEITSKFGNLQELLDFCKDSK